MDKPNIVAFQPQGPEAWEYEDQWSTSLCDCDYNVGECCYGFFFYPCFSCNSEKILFKNVIETFYYNFTFILGHMAWKLRETACVVCCFPPSISVLRGKIRTMFRINVIKCHSYF